MTVKQILPCLGLSIFCFISGYQRQEPAANSKRTVVRELQKKDQAIVASTFNQGPNWIGEPVLLFDGKSLAGWETIEFGGEGTCDLEDGAISLGAGVTMSGISSTRSALPQSNYEVSLEARKIDGTDFFCGLTFPVAESHCTLIVGGWGGTLIGLSCIDDADASSNDTASYLKFESEQWYKIRVRVEPDRISAWIDERQVVDENIAGKKISLRGDTDLCRPLGLCNFMTSSQYKNIQVRQFKPNSETKPATDSEKTQDASGETTTAASGK